MNMRVAGVVHFVILLLMAGCLPGSCQQQTFDKAAWCTREEAGWPPVARESMLDDLMRKHTLTGLRYKELINLCGEPDGIERDTAYYNIVVDYGIDIDPVYVKNLKFVFSKDSLTTGVSVSEWRK
jgi:hypothetical protein